ncbi:SPFH domain-containing protein [Robiginitalea aurantiaca]|uniref:SPFH domain-containing protein n=1 Tax=Robiginitalea aurantiaca TaxID=3056915 RepID=A0ABT7WCR0_9FLAO|nr:SPFH domain-containing protein [Robiginitalea aurantiaca]MDM9630689.1 SPFH domain-containing protein [Robiginitalea aurantiaca]
MKSEKHITPSSGYSMLFVLFLLLVLMIGGLLFFRNPLFLLMAPFLLLFMRGFFTVNPNSSKVMVLFGAYKGTVRENGFFWANPFYTRQRISLRARNFDSERVKVNDKIGNPILINVILVWQVEDTFKSAFDVDNYEEFVRVQTDAAVRKLAGSYPYDNFDDEQAELTLRSGMDEVNEALEVEITERLQIAGIKVIEARIGYLAYAPEIANSMLKRQQAVAIVAARKKIVEGAVGMVEDALEQLSRDNIIDFDDDKRASMVSNLMVVLCGDKEAVPIVNAGTLNG